MSDRATPRCFTTHTLGQLPALLTTIACLATGAGPLHATEPFLIDLRPVLNTSWEDDGIPGNGKGGWSDEGVNDLYLWPPFATGKGLHNGFPFEVVDGAQNNGKGVLMLAGKKGRAGLPEQVDVAVPKATGRYLYLLMNSVLGHPPMDDPNPVALTATLRYADGSAHDFPLREGIELAPWWTQAKKPFNNPPLISLVHLGENIIASGQFRVGVWATRLENPTPQLPVTGLLFRSHGLSVPCIFAATLSDVDYSSKATLPPTNSPPPAGYFDAKENIRQLALYNAARVAGFIQGVRDSTVLRADLVAITFDNALTRDNGYNRNPEITTRFHNPAHWTISSSDDPDFKMGRRPVAVGHKNFERYNGPVGTVPSEYLYWNEYYVRLPSPMKPGHQYTVAVDGMETGLINKIDIAYNDRGTISHAIKVNQVGYSLSGRERWAYLGWWAGSLGAIDYADLTAYEVVNEANDKTVKQGKIELRAAADLPSGENVYQINLSGIGAGRYHVVIPGLGRSETFRIGADATAEAGYHTFRAFFHQRCGHELKPPYSLANKPACHVECWESGFLVGNPEYKPKPGEAKRSFTGGYHDAGDYDVHPFDSGALGEPLMVFECHPEYFTDGQFNLPESGKGLPDILSEAKWALSFWLENQLESGAVPFGRGNDQDLWAWTFGDQNKRSPFGIVPPTNDSTPTYAAFAAQVSMLIRPFDKVYADRLLKSALRAMDYAWLQKPEPYPVVIDAKTKQPKVNRVEHAQILWALGECYRATGDAKLLTKIAEFFPLKNNAKHPTAIGIEAKTGHYLWPLARCSHPLPPAITTEARKILLDMADTTLRQTQESAYRLGTGKYLKASMWGGASAVHYGDILARAHALTKDPKYLDGLALNYDFHFGVNPPAATFVTGMGWNPPKRAEISRFLYYKWKAAHPEEDPLRNGGPPSLECTMVPGISVYGLGLPLWYYPTKTDPGGPWPLMHSHRDLWGNGSEHWNEFTLVQMIGPAATMTLYLAAEDHALAAK